MEKLSTWHCHNNGGHIKRARGGVRGTFLIMCKKISKSLYSMLDSNFYDCKQTLKGDNIDH